MQFTRTMGAAIAAACLIVPAATATADAATPIRAGVSAHHSEAAAAKPHRTFTKTKVTQPKTGLIKFRTHIVNYASKATILQRKDCKAASCKWHKTDAAKTDKFGNVHYRLGAPATGRWYWRIGTPETAKFAASYSPVAYTYSV